MKYWGLSMLASLLVTLLAACGPSPARPAVQHDAAAAPAQVQLDMFSGRPPPTWTLSAADTQTLRALLPGLPATNEPPPEGQLGYRGFIVTMPHTTAAPASTLLVYHSLIVSDSDGTARMLHDADRRVEQMLVASANGYIDAEIYAVLVHEVAKP